MQELIFYALLLAGGYYLLIHRPNQEKVPPLLKNASLQTDPLINHEEKELEKTIDLLIRNIRQLQRELK